MWECLSGTVLNFLKQFKKLLKLCNRNFSFFIEFFCCGNWTLLIFLLLDLTSVLLIARWLHYFTATSTSMPCSPISVPVMLPKL